MTRERFANERQGEWAEEYVADRFDLDHTPEAEWYDCINPRNSTKWEVKSATVELADGSEGRFRLWEEQHRSLTASDGQGTAWYAFVALDASGNVAEFERMHATTVTDLVRERGGWNRGGHDRRDGRQHKVPVSEVIK